ncbi:MAG: glycosyltransferase family 2 protein, partial [bacterium]
MDKQTNPTLSIIIVNYNVKEELVNCIESIEHSIGSDKNPVSYEIIVSDNGSIDGSVEAVREKFPWVKIIENKANLGFGKANNIGAQ